jgi:hypothetical protein
VGDDYYGFHDDSLLVEQMGDNGHWAIVVATLTIGVEHDGTDRFDEAF